MHRWRLLQVRAGICEAQLQDMDAALEHFHALFAVDAVDFADLYLSVGDMLSEQRHFDQVRLSERCHPYNLLVHIVLTAELQVPSFAWRQQSVSVADLRR